MGAALGAMLLAVVATHCGRERAMQACRTSQARAGAAWNRYREALMRRQDDAFNRGNQARSRQYDTRSVAEDEAVHQQIQRAQAEQADLDRRLRAVRAVLAVGSDDAEAVRRVERRVPEDRDSEAFVAARRASDEAWEACRGLRR